MTKYLTIMILFLLVFCKENNNLEPSNVVTKKIIITKPTNKLNEFSLNSNSIENLKKNSIENGDARSYCQLIIYYNREKNNVNFFDLQSITLTMANKYNDANACKQAYIDIIKFYNNGIFKESLFLKLNKKNKKDAMFYLKKGVDLGDFECKISLAKHYKNGIGILKNVKIADSLIYSLKLNKITTNDILSKL